MQWTHCARAGRRMCCSARSTRVLAHAAAGAPLIALSDSTRADLCTHARLIAAYLPTAARTTIASPWSLDWSPATMCCIIIVSSESCSAGAPLTVAPGHHKRAERASEVASGDDAFDLPESLSVGAGLGCASQLNLTT